MGKTFLLDRFAEELTVVMLQHRLPYFAGRP